MRIQTSEHYISNRAWLRDVVGEKDLILRGVSALEYLQLFVGYAGEETVEVYSLQRGAYENIDYRVVDSFKRLRRYAMEMFCVRPQIRHSTICWLSMRLLTSLH